MFRSLFLIVFVVGISFPSVGSPTNWNLNDVSYLFKIPTTSNETLRRLLAPQEIGAKGELLPLDVYQQLPTLLNAGHGNATLYKGALRVVAVRIDPCPNLEEENCFPEVRMVWQPIEKSFKLDLWESRDGAVHTFYRLSLVEFEVLKAQLWQLKVDNYDSGIDTDGMPLNIHPAQFSEKLALEFSKRMREILLQHCGEKNFFKMTFMSLLVPTRWWRFGGFVYDRSGKWIPAAIPRLTDNIEDLFNVALEENGASTSPAIGMDAIFNTLPEDYPEEDNIFSLINKSYRYNSEQDLDVFKNKLNAVARFRNPYKTNPDSLDCTSCHYADASEFYAFRRFPSLSEFISSDVYKNPDQARYNLTNTTIAPLSTRIIRSFGYFDSFPAINQRVINDSAESAHWLNTH